MSAEVIHEPVGCFDCKQGALRAARFNADGNYCITCGADKTIKLWNPHKVDSHGAGLLLKTYSGHGYEVIDAHCSCDSSQLCSCSLDKTVFLWDVATGKITTKFRGHAGRVNCVQFNEDSSVVISGSVDGTVRIWDCRTKRQQPVQILDEAKDSVTSVHVSDYEILTGSADCQLRRYDLRNGQLHSDYIGSPVTCVSLSGDGQCILTSTLSSRLCLIDKDTGELLNEYAGHENSKYRVDSIISSSDKHILSGSEDGYLYIWHLVDGTQACRLAHGEGSNTGGVVNSLSSHPTLPRVVSTYHNKLYIWNITQLVGS